MDPVTVILSSLGGVIALGTCVFMFVRAVARLVRATVENTEALTRMQETLLGLGTTVSQHTVEIAVLQDRIKR